MSVHRLIVRPYYQYDGPSQKNPFRTKFIQEAEMKAISTIILVLLFILFTSLASGAINEHILYVELDQYWDYGNASEQPNILGFGFSFVVEADSSVEKIEFLTPGGKHVVMTNPEFNGEYGSWWKFEHDYYTFDQSDLADYGDGVYQMTVFYYSEDPNQTSIVYSGLSQPTQKPVPVYPEPNQSVISLVAFEWEPYLGSAANNVWFDVLDLQGNEVIDTIDQSVDATGTDDIQLNVGSYVASIGFENTQPYVNSDGIYITRWKTSSIEWNFTVRATCVGDIDGSGEVDLYDLIIATKIISGIATGQDVHQGADINSDNKIGLEEAIYILQKVARIK